MIRLVIGAAIREHGIDLGGTRVSVKSNPSRIADIKRRAADLFDAIETIGDEDPPSEIAQLKPRAMTDIEAGSMRAAKSAAQSGRRVTRLVTCRLAASAPRAEAPLATPAARLDRCRLATRTPRVGASHLVPRPPGGTPRRRPHRTTPDAPRALMPPLAGAARPVRRPPRRGPTRDVPDAPTRLPFVST